MLSGVSSEPMRRSFLLLGCLLLPVVCIAGEPTALERLTASLAGVFSNTYQARGDDNFRDVALHVAPIWTDRTDGPWLYAEQALSAAPDHPYRQRIYHLAARPDGTLEVRLFEMPDPIAVTGAWKDPSLLTKLTPSALTSPEGCILVLQVQSDGSFKGGTVGKGYANTQRGASYATTVITVTAKETVIWERGYNAAGTQVWGSIHGGYEFKKSE